MRPCSPALAVVLLTACAPIEMATSDSAAMSTSQADTGTATTDTTDATPTTGDPPDPCECVDPVVVEGNLDTLGLDGFQGFCIAEVTGTLTIENVTDPATLGPLARLRRAGHLYIEGNPGLVDVSALGCLEEVEGALVIENNPALVGFGGLGRLHRAGGVTLGYSPITTLPGFAPGFHVDTTIVLESLPKIVDLDPLAGWSSVPGTEDVYVRLTNLPALTSIAGLAGPLGPPGTLKAEASLEFSRLLALPSLAGIEAVTRGDIVFSGLPKVTSLAPLAALEQVGLLHLIAMKSLGSLQGLGNLTIAHEVQLGGCGPFDGVPGLIDLTGLDSLKQVGETLSILGAANLVALIGAPKLSSAAYIDIVDNPKLGVDAVAAFEAQVTHKHMCFGTVADCGCLGRLPDAVTSGCAEQWSGGSAVVTQGPAGLLDGTTAFFAFREFATDRYLTLVVIDAAADIATAIADGPDYTSEAGGPKLLFENMVNYQDWIGVSTEYAELDHPGGQENQFLAQVTVTGRMGNWLMYDPADPPRLVGEFATAPNATTSISGPFDAAFCEAFASSIQD